MPAPASNLSVQAFFEKKQREVEHVHEENQASARSALRIIESLSKEGEAARIAEQASPAHADALLSALALQCHTFSGGAIPNSSSTPLYLRLLTQDQGLRVLTPEYVGHADRLLGAFGLPAARDLASRYVAEPAVAYRLAQFELTQKLLETGSLSEAERSELSIRIQARTSLDPIELQARLGGLADRPQARLRVIASFLARSVKRGQALDARLFETMKIWIAGLDERTLIQDPLLAAQVLNSLNLILLKQGDHSEVSERLDFIEARVLPRIESPEVRAHVEGNYLFQRSILRRIAGDTESETRLLLQAMEKDAGFATLYYRMAQLLHDRLDERASFFYLQALAVSPFDYPTANDYGCFLSETGQTEKLRDWADLCKVVFGEGQAQ